MGGQVLVGEIPGLLCLPGESQSRQFFLQFLNPRLFLLNHSHCVFQGSVVALQFAINFYPSIKYAWIILYLKSGTHTIFYTLESSQMFSNSLKNYRKENFASYLSTTIFPVRSNDALQLVNHFLLFSNLYVCKIARHSSILILFEHCRQLANLVLSIHQFHLKLHS